MISPVVAAAALSALLGCGAILWFGTEKLCFAFVVGGIALSALNALRAGGGLTISDALYVLAVALLLSSAMISGRQFRDIPSWLWISALLFAVAAALTAVFPAAPSEAALFFLGGAFNQVPGEEIIVYSNFEALLRLELPLLLVPFVMVQVAKSWGRVRLLADAWLGGTALGALFGITVYIGLIHGSAFIGGNTALGNERIKGLSVHPNVFGVTAAMVLPLAATFFSSSAGRRKLAYLSLLILLPAAILASGSRAAVFGGIFGLALLAIMDPRSRVALRRIAVAGLLVILMIGIASIRALPGISRLSGESGALESDATREAIYTRVISEIGERPVVGHGFEYLRGSNNIYLQALHAGGVIGFAGLLVLVGGVIYTGWRVAGRSRQPIVGALLASALTWLAVDGMFEPAIYDRYLYVPIGLLAACWAISRRERAPSREAVDARNRLHAPKRQVDG